MSEKKPYVVEIGQGGRIHLPKDVMKALDAVPGNQIRFEIGEDSVRILRHLLICSQRECRKNTKSGPRTGKISGDKAVNQRAGTAAQSSTG